MIVAGSVALILSMGSFPAWAQLNQRPVAFQNARILTMDGAEIPSGTLLIRGEKIVAVGADVKLPVFTRKIDTDGGTITPGFIDVASLLGRPELPGSGSAGQGRAVHRAEDAFDYYDSAQLTEALRHGVTAFYLAPGNTSGIGGMGAILRLAPDPSRGPALGSVLTDRAALVVNLASASRPVARLKNLAAIRKQFRTAVEYRRTLDDYREDVREYQKALKEWVAKQRKEKENDSASKKSQQGEQEEPSQEGRSESPTAAAEAKKPADEKAQGDTKEAGQDTKEGKPKKPQRPQRQPDSEIILEALDRKLPVRIVAHRSEDILNAIELADEFSLQWILEGGSEAHLVAEALANANVPVILENLARSSVPRDNILRRASWDRIGRLKEAGVSWLVGSGADRPADARFVLMNAQLATARGGSGNPLQLVTNQAADTLGVGDEIGRLRAGYFADFVVWSGCPLEPATEVRQVYVNGKAVYEHPSP